MISSLFRLLAISFAQAQVSSSAKALSAKLKNPNLKATKQSSLNFFASFHSSMI